MKKILFEENKFEILDEKLNILVTGSIEKSKLEVINVGVDSWGFFIDYPGGCFDMLTYMRFMNNFVTDILGFQDIAEFYGKLDELLPGEGRISGIRTWPFINVKTREDLIYALVKLVGEEYTIKEEDLFE